MTTREYKNYKRMTKMTVRFLENHESSLDSLKAAAAVTSTTTTTSTTTPTMARLATNVPERPSLLHVSEVKNRQTDSQSVATTKTKTTTTTMTRSSVAALPDNGKTLSWRDKLEEFLDKSRLTVAIKEEEPPNGETTTTNGTQHQDAPKAIVKEPKPELGRYTNWNSQHTTLASLPWCCIGDLMAFCDKYEYRTINRNDLQMHGRIVAEVKSLLCGQAPFDMRKRFPADIRSPENLWVCVGRCTGVEYHLNRILSVFRRPMDKLPAEKQRILRHDFHLAVAELRLDISARISEVRLYDRNVFEREFRLEWQDETPSK